jgi:hypothetical protein
MRGSPSCSGVQAKRSLGIGGKPWSAPLGRPGWPEEAFEVAATGLQVHTTGQGDRFRVLRSIEMDVFADGSSDMNAAALDRLDLVLGAFHTRLRGRRIRPSATWPH